MAKSEYRTEDPVEVGAISSPWLWVYEICSDPKLVHLLNYYANIMTEDFQQYLIELSRFIFAPNVVSER